MSERQENTGTAGIEVGHFGIHRAANGIVYLHQGRGGVNATGHRERSPFHVRLEGGRQHCNHHVPLAAPVVWGPHWRHLMDLIHDPMVRAMLPIPKDTPEALFLSTNWTPDRPDRRAGLPEQITALARLSSPLWPNIVRADLMKPDSIMQGLGSSNIQPILIYDAAPRHRSQLDELACLSRSQAARLIIIGEPGCVDLSSRDGAREIGTEVRRIAPAEFSLLPWENIGATVVRKFMRGEWTGGVVEPGTPERPLLRAARAGRAAAE